MLKSFRKSIRRYSAVTWSDRRREHIDLAKLTTEKSVQKRRFAGFDLTHHDKEEWLAELRNQVLQVAQSVLRRPDLVCKSHQRSESRP